MSMLRCVISVLLALVAVMAIELLAFRLSRDVGELGAVMAPLCFGVAIANGVGRAVWVPLLGALIGAVATALLALINHLLLEQIALTGLWSVSSLQHLQPAYVMMIAPVSCAVSAALTFWIVRKRRRKPGATGED